MNVTVDAKLTTKEMYNFLLYSNYCSFGGIVGVIIGLGALVLAGFLMGNDEIRVEYKFALLCIGIIYIFVQPILLYKKAAKQVKTSDSINKPLKYIFDENGITITLGDEKVTHKYDEVFMIKSTKISVFIYITRYRAFILPRKDIGNQMAEFTELLRKNVHNARCINIK